MAVSEAPLVSVVVRTKDRPALLAEALGSLRAQTFPDFDVVVVNDGGAPPPASVLEPPPGRGLALVDTVAPGGRSRALNAGLAAARGRFVSYLDDDDLFLPGHLAEHVARLTGEAPPRASYSDVEHVFQTRGPDGLYRETRREPAERREFDGVRLLYANFIPLIALVHERSLADEIGGFDDSFDLYEDWDFLIRLSRIAPPRRVPVTTALYRIRDDGTNATTEAPWLGPRAQAARGALTLKHWALRTPETEMSILDASDHAVRRVPELEAQVAALRASRDAEAAAIAERLAVVRHHEADLRSATDRYRLLSEEIERSLAWRVHRRWSRLRELLRR